MSIARLSSTSRALFGQKYMLSVALAVARAEPGVVFAKQIAEETGVAANVVGGILKRFVEARVLDQINPHTGGGERVMYERRPSAFWDLCAEFADEVLMDAPSRPHGE